MAKPDVRHHSYHPPSVVSPNLAVNQKPNPEPVERAAEPAPNPNPSLGAVGVPLDPVNSRLDKVKYPLMDVPASLASKRGNGDAVSDPDSPLYNPQDPNFDPEWLEGE
jgi:hypothetical protein